MSDIELYRKQLDDIDQEMRHLFVERMEIVSKVGHWKSLNNFPIYDPVRENQMIEKNVKALGNSDVSRYYEEFLKTLIKLSKDYQIALSARVTNYL